MNGTITDDTRFIIEHPDKNGPDTHVPARMGSSDTYREDNYSSSPKPTAGNWGWLNSLSTRYPRAYSAWRIWWIWLVPS